MPKPAKSRTEFIVSITAVIVSIAAAYIAYNSLQISKSQGEETRKHNRLSVTPILQFGEMMGENETYYGIVLSNIGTGPALIEKWDVFVNDQKVGEFKQGWDIAKEKLGIPSLKIPSVTSEWPGSIKAGDTRPIFWVGKSTWNGLSPEQQEEFKQAMYKIKLIVEYVSIYKERYDPVIWEKSEP